MSRTREAFFAIALSLSAASGSAWAQPAANPNDQLAREHFMRGRDTFSEGDFATAAREFNQAYELSRRPQLLYNIGTAYERMHNWNEASVAFHRYLDEVPDAPDRGEVEARLRAIEIELLHVSTATQPQETTTRVVVVERSVSAPVEPSRPWRTAFFITGGLTVIGGGVTLAVGLVADARYNTLARNCAQTAAGCTPDDVDDMRLRQTLVNAGIAATSAFAAATVAFFIIDLARPTPHPVGPLPVHAAFVPLTGGGLLAIEGSL